MDREERKLIDRTIELIDALHKEVNTYQHMEFSDEVSDVKNKLTRLSLRRSS